MPADDSTRRPVPVGAPVLFLRRCLSIAEPVQAERFRGRESDDPQRGRRAGRLRGGEQCAENGRGRRFVRDKKGRTCERSSGLSAECSRAALMSYQWIVSFENPMPVGLCIRISDD